MPALWTICGKVEADPADQQARFDYATAPARARSAAIDELLGGLRRDREWNGLPKRAAHHHFDAEGQPIRLRRTPPAVVADSPEPCRAVPTCPTIALFLLPARS